jgi:hypothetical protein
MSAQARKLVATTTYELESGQAALLNLFLAQQRANVERKTAFWPGAAFDEEPLEQRLRLPKRF